jgi:hypothetical protein
VHHWTLSTFIFEIVLAFLLLCCFAEFLNPSAQSPRSTMVSVRTVSPTSASALSTVRRRFPFPSSFLSFPFSLHFLLFFLTLQRLLHSVDALYRLIHCADSSPIGFGGDHDRAVEAGKKGGSTQPDEVYKPSEHGGLKKNGEPDKRTSSEHGTSSLVVFISISYLPLLLSFRFRCRPRARFRARQAGRSQDRRRRGVNFGRRCLLPPVNSCTIFVTK